jgi:hypothetical protein
MKSKYVLTGMLILALVASAIVIGVYAQTPRQSGRPRNAIQGPIPKADGGIPEHIFYEHVFQSLVALKNIDDYKTQVGLGEREAAELLRVASDCVSELARQDAKAQVVIKAFRAQVKKLKAGEALPAPPQKLKDMQNERDALVLRQVQRLRQSVGFEKFDRISEAGRRIVRIQIKPASQVKE